MLKIFNYLSSFANKEHYFVKILQVMLFVLLVALMFPQGKSTLQEYEIGAIWTDDNLIAEFSFPVFKSEDDYNQESKKALENIYDIYKKDKLVLDEQIGLIEKFTSNLHLLNKTEIKNKMEEKGIKFSDSDFEVLKNLDAKQLKDELHFILTKIYNVGVSSENIDSSKLIIIRDGITEELIYPDLIYNLSEVEQALKNLYLKYFYSSDEIRNLKIKISLLYVEPNIIFLKDVTLAERKIAISNIPLTSGTVSKGEVIVNNGDIISKEIFLKLNAYEKINFEKGDIVKILLSFLGKYLYVFFITILFLSYLFYFEKKIFFNNSDILLILSVLLFESLLAFLVNYFELQRPYRFLIPIPLIGIFLTIIFNSYVGFLTFIVASFLIGGIFGNDYPFLMQMLIGGSVSVISVKDVTERTQIFRSMLFVFIGFTIFLSIHTLMLNSEFSIAGISLLFSALNAIFSSLLAYFFIILLEKYFSYSTNFALLEFDNLNHRLLKKLSNSASGTYNHSLVMSTLANNAASSIGANSILAKVGALFHDIGKIENPNAFNENHFAKKKNISKIDPKLQAQIIRKHISAGIEIARKEKLPNSVIDFIPMHHGTRLIGNFYELAKSLNKKEQKIDENDFRYFGPRPNTKETAIVMLADAIEASTRAIKKPTIKSIEENIDKIIEERLREGELDEAPLTVKELAKIKSSFLKILVGYYHTRIISPSKN